MAHSVTFARAEIICRRSLEFCVVGRVSSERSDDQALLGCQDDVRRQRAHVVDLRDAFDLGEQPLDQTKVAARDVGDGMDHVRLSEVVEFQAQTELQGLALDDGLQLKLRSRVETGERSRSASTAVRNGPAASAARHTDKHHAHLSAIVEVA